MKKYDPAEHFGESHVKIPALAAMLGVSPRTAKRILKAQPDLQQQVLTLPERKDPNKSRSCRTQLIPESVARELYIRLKKPA